VVAVSAFCLIALWSKYVPREHYSKLDLELSSAWHSLGLIPGNCISCKTKSSHHSLLGPWFTSMSCANLLWLFWVLCLAASSPTNKCATVTVPSFVASNLTSLPAVARMRCLRDLTPYERRNTHFVSVSFSMNQTGSSTNRGFYFFFFCNANSARYAAKQEGRLSL